MPRREKRSHTNDLYQAILTLQSEEECIDFFKDVCSNNELLAMEQRYNVAKMLDDGKTYLVSTHGCALRAMLNFLYEDPCDYWHGHVPYNCAVNIIEGRNGVGRLIADDKIYYELADAVDQYAKF